MSTFSRLTHLRCRQQTISWKQTCSANTLQHHYYTVRIQIRGVLIQLFNFQYDTNIAALSIVIQIMQNKRHTVYPVISVLPARVLLLYKMSQVVIVVKIELWNKFLKKIDKISKWNLLIILFTFVCNYVILT